MSLPVPNLDDRKFQDIVDEAKRLIPTYCPEWTNHNVSDPGVALIELFAWMSEMIIFRLNQTPDKLYSQFLNLLGVRPFSARAATTELTFWLSSTTEPHVVVPAGTEVGTDTIGESEVFTTVRDLVVVQPSLAAAYTGHLETSMRDVMAELQYDRDSVRCFPSDPIEPGDAFYLGFEASLAGQVVRLTVQASTLGVGIDPERPPAVWEVWSGEYWVPCQVYSDSTGGINRNGQIVLLVPMAHEPLTLEGLRLWWMRWRYTEAAPDQPTYGQSPEVQQLSVTCLGGTALGEHSVRIDHEIVGRSTGVPGQEFALKQRPVLPRRPDEVVHVSAPTGESDWMEVADFSMSGPNDQHVVWDEAMGIVHFGPAVRHADGSIVQHGSVPPEGAIISVSQYRSGGGTAGNVGAGTLTRLRTTIPFVDRVENLKAARGGVEPESDDNVKLRGPMSLRTGQRAVTMGDFERIALESTSQMVRARCLRPTQPGRPVRLLVVPQVEKRPALHTIDDYQLSDPLFHTVSAYVDERRLLGSSVEVTTPYFVGVSVAALVRAATGRPTAVVREDVLEQLYRMLNPIVGGPDSKGWPWDVSLTTASLTAAVAEVAGVAAVDDLVMFAVDLRNGQRIGDAKEALRLDQRSLFLSFNHQVVVR